MNARAGVRSPDHELTIIRTFDAPRSAIFAAWTIPSKMERWMGPSEFTAREVEADVRPEGAWRLCLRHVDRTADLWQGGVYKEVREPERLAFTFAWQDGKLGPRGHETLVVLSFTEHDGKTIQSFHQGPFDAVDARDSHEFGWNSAFDRLAEYFEERYGADAGEATQLAASPRLA